VKRILGLLGWLGVALVLAAVLIRFFKPDFEVYGVRDVHQYLALAGLVVTALYALSQWRDIGRSFQGKNVKYGSIAATSVVLVLGILVALNYIGSRQNKRWDLTTNKQFSLSDQTRQILRDLKKPVAIRAYHEPGDDRQVRDRLSEYTYTSSQVKVDYIDPLRKNLQAQADKITQAPTLIIEYDGRTERANGVDEQTVSNALKKLIEGRVKKLYFVTGHGEHDSAAGDAMGYSRVVQGLTSDNFETAKLTLAQEGKIPDDATVIVVGGPKADFLAGEVDLLRGYLKRGGKVALLLDPPAKADDPPLTNLVAFAKEWGIEIGNNLVIDTSGLGRLIGTNESVPIGMPAPHAITNESTGQMTAFPLARSVTPIEGGTDGKIAQKFVETGPRSWAESDLKTLFATQKTELNADKGDKAGPVSIGVAVSAPAPDAPAGATPDAPKPEARLVVFGDSDFIANRFLDAAGNRELFLNSGSWLAQQESLIAIRPKDPADQRITLTQDQGTRIFWFAIFVLPGLLFANAVRVWWKRR
jgi:ABC-type uncharacterized transport system involved in gliding motility auxiliary subunit